MSLAAAQLSADARNAPQRAESRNAGSNEPRKRRSISA